MRQLPSSVIALWSLGVLFFVGGTVLYLFFNSDTYMHRRQAISLLYAKEALGWAQLPDIPKKARDLKCDESALFPSGDKITISFTLPIAEARAWINKGDVTQIDMLEKKHVMYKLNALKGGRGGWVKLAEQTGHIDVEIIHGNSM